MAEGSKRQNQFVQNAMADQPLVTFDELKEYEECIRLLSEWEKTVSRARAVIMRLDPQFRKEYLSLLNTGSDSSGDSELSEILREYLNNAISEKMAGKVKSKSNDFKYIPPPSRITECIDMLKSAIYFNTTSSSGGTIDVEKVLNDEEKERKEKK